ncbi:MAG: DinB family protein [Pirellulaceae bacterium]|nr:DinB family protein [Pirellulaceae bacterium]
MTRPKSADAEPPAAAELQLLLRMLDDAFRGPSWHGPALRGSLRGLTSGQAVARPQSGRHNIWEQMLHAAYWKYTVHRRLRGEQRGSFPLAGSNWFERADASDASGWRRELALLDSMHEQLRTAVAALPEERLREPIGRSGKLNHEQLIRGIALHDIYHAGQIQLLKRLLAPR